MSGKSDKHQPSGRQFPISGELLSSSLISSLRGFKKHLGEWKGTIKLQGQNAHVLINLLSSSFPVVAKIDITKGNGHESWRLTETNKSLRLQLITAEEETMFVSSIVEPEEHLTQVGANLIFKRGISKPSQQFNTHDVDLGRSTVTGSGKNSVKDVVRELGELCFALKHTIV